jgi:hypothetical protein
MMDSVEWAMPALIRMFTQDDAIRFEADSPEEEQAAEDASAYVGHLFYRMNEGFTVLHDAIKSALIQKLGWIKVYCDESEDRKAEHYAGLSQQEVDSLKQDDEITVTKVTQDGQIMGDPSMQPPPQPGQPPQSPAMEPTFAVVAERKTTKRKIVCEAIPPEEIRISREERDIRRPRYIAHEREMSVSDLLGMGIPQDAIDEATASATVDLLTEKYDRHAFYDSPGFTRGDLGDESQRPVVITEAYLSVDFDGDGIAEYRKVVKVGRYIHENEEVDDHNLACLRPLRMPHQIAGLSFYDLTEDLQRIQTALTRQMLDNAYLANNPQKVVIEGQVNFDDLLNPRIGGIIRAKSLEAVRTESTQFIGPQALALMQHFTQVQETRTGVTEMNSALNSDALAKSNIGSQGIQQLVGAGQQRLELVARSLADDLKRVWYLLLKHAIQYTDRQTQMKISGHWMQIDPSAWRNDYRMTVSVGVGHAGKQEKVAHFQMIAQAQQELMPLGGVTSENAYNTAADFIKLLGFEPDRYVSQPGPPQPPQTPPEVQVEQLKQSGALQVEQTKQQGSQQAEYTKHFFHAQHTQHLNELEAQRGTLQLQQQHEVNTTQLQNQHALSGIEIESKAGLAKYQADLKAQTAIHIARISAEATIAAAKVKGAADASTVDADEAYQRSHETD